MFSLCAMSSNQCAMSSFYNLLILLTACNVCRKINENDMKLLQQKIHAFYTFLYLIYRIVITVNIYILHSLHSLHMANNNSKLSKAVHCTPIAHWLLYITHLKTRIDVFNRYFVEIIIKMVCLVCDPSPTHRRDLQKWRGF